MQIGSRGYENANANALKNANMADKSANISKNPAETKDELSVEEQINKSAIEVSISMNAQIILFSMDSADRIKDNTTAQQDILKFLSGEEVSEDFNIKNTGYEGKPITELSVEEAGELISEEGFFGIDKTSQRVADFVFSFSGDDIDLLQKGREGIVKGFEEAKQMWGDELPQISHDTQTKTLELIDKKIEELQQNN